MKKLSQLITEAKEKLDIQEDSLGYASAKDIEKYLEICDKFISDETKEICKFLISHNNTYMTELPGADNGENALASFYDNGVPKEEKYKNLYKAIGTLNRKNRLIEVPVFQTKEQFDKILNKEIAPDEVLLDLTSEAGRNKVAKQYEPLVHKIARSFFGKSNLEIDDLISAGYQGLTYAMNNYGKKTDKSKVEDDQIKVYTFTQYASYMIRFAILEDIKNLSQIVRVPISQQNKERKEKGYNTRNNTTSGDETVGNDSDGNSKTMFDYMDSSSDGEVDKTEQDELMKKIYQKVKDHFDGMTLDIWQAANGLGPYNDEPLKKKDIAKKYNIVSSNVSYYLHKVNMYINNDKELKELFYALYECVKEIRHELDENEPIEPTYISERSKNTYSLY